MSFNSGNSYFNSKSVLVELDFVQFLETRKLLFIIKKIAEEYFNAFVDTKLLL